MKKQFNWPLVYAIIFFIAFYAILAFSMFLLFGGEGKEYDNIMPETSGSTPVMIIEELPKIEEEETLPFDVVETNFGIASYYKFHLCQSEGGRYIGKTSGCNDNEKFIEIWGDDEIFVAARDYERYSWVKVTNEENGESIIAQVIDFGPDKSIHPERIVDLSYAAFSKIADPKKGVVAVSVQPYEVFK